MRQLSAFLLLACAGSAASIPLPYASLSVGSEWHDASLEDYRWDAGMHRNYGLELGLDGGRWRLGIREAHSATRQGTGIPGLDTALDVKLRYLGLRAHRDFLHGAGFTLHGMAGVGRLTIGYEPDRLEVDLGGSQPASVEFADIDEWQYEFGLGVLRQLTGPLALGLLVTHQSFALDTEHRVGTNTEQSRDRFGTWTGQLSLHFSFGGP